MAVRVTVENFSRAETARMFAALQNDAGDVNSFQHVRAPTPVEHQTVIRMNRDTLYSFAIVDLAEGATLSIPEAGDRYVSVMVVNEDHYINRVFHEPGDHELGVDEFETPYVVVGARVLVDPANDEDVAEVNALQDHFGLRPGSARPFEMPDYESESLDAVRKAVLELAKHSGAFDHAFGRKDDVDPVRHLLGTAAGWGGLPDSEARYLGVFPHLPVGEYKLTVGAATTTDPTSCRSWRVGTTSSGSTDPAPKCWTSHGRSPRSSRRKCHPATS